MLLKDVKYFFLNPKIITSDTINPWARKFPQINQRNEAVDQAVSWLLTSQKKMSDDGFGSYSILNGWTTSYPETTGYIIPTLIEYSNKRNKEVAKESALKAANWLLAIQKKSGGWQGGYLEHNDDESVFNTGQILRGLMAAYKETTDDKYLGSIERGCDWLCSVQDSQGLWGANSYLSMVRVYDSYVDTPLLMAYSILKKEEYKETAVKNLDWILTKQLGNGWFQDCDNTEWGNDQPILHTICYTIDGLLDCGILLNESKYIEAATLSANSLFDKFNKRKFLAGRLDNNWKGTVDYMILTGYAQLAIIWLKFYKLTKNIQYLNAAMKLNDFLIFTQDRGENESVDTKWAIAGSFPIWSDYQPYTFPNWATKYFVDSLLLEQECLKQIEEETVKYENQLYHR